MTLIILWAVCIFFVLRQWQSTWQCFISISRTMPVCREQREMNQGLLEPARTFPWVSGSFHSAPFIADFLKEPSSPLGSRFAKKLSRWEAAWENLLVNAKQKQRGAELSGGAGRRFPEARSQGSVPTCSPTKQTARL